MKIINSFWSRTLQSDNSDGGSEINPDKVKEAIKFFIERCTQTHRHQSDIDDVVPGLRIFSTGELTYYGMIYHLPIKDLKNSNNPIQSLLLDLVQRVVALGFPVSRLNVVIEKGCVASSDPKWHVDMNPTRMISYSSNEKWSTQIISREGMKDFVSEREYRDYLHTGRLVKSATLDGEKLDSKKQLAKLGSIYNGGTLVHRSTKDSDIEEGIGENDYHLFIQFEGL